MLHQIEIIAIGNEILKGMIVNSNAAEIASALFKSGYQCCHQAVIPDDRELMKAHIRDSLLKKRIVITTGGLGPTCDDITRQVAAEVYDSGFAFNEELAEDLKQRYGNKHISLQDQATVPIKASILNNPFGTAPGIVFNTELGTLILMPGVPKEMRAMLHDQLIPYLKKHFPVENPPISRAVHLFNISESAVDASLRKLQNSFPDVDFGIYPSHGLLSIHATISCEKKDSSKQLDEVTEILKSEFANHFYSDNSARIEQVIQELFIKHGWTLSTAESCSGGAVAARLTKVPGASEYFLGGIVSYSSSLKEKLLHVDRSVIDAHSAVSEETTKAMALGALEATESDFSLAITGIAGPSGGSDACPVGTVWIAIGKKGSEVVCHRRQCYGNRDMIIEQSVNVALGYLYRHAFNTFGVRNGAVA